MDVLWAPWRSQYIDTFKDEDKNKKLDCFFCEAAVSTGRSKELLVVARRKLCFAMLNKFPYNNGHTLIAPYRHVGDIDDLSDDELSELTFTVRQVKQALQQIYKPHGFNVGLNLGRTAGAGVPGHMHFHIVPRWDGDTSYMTIFADVNVVSESLKQTQEILSTKINEMFPD